MKGTWVSNSLLSGELPTARTCFEFLEIENNTVEKIRDYREDVCSRSFHAFN